MLSGRSLEDARILVVDDEPLNVSLLTALLDKAGFGEVLGLTNSGEVMAAVASFEPDLVMLDLHMPDPNGMMLLEMIERATSADSYLPVIVLTADVSDETRQRALALGAADFLTKPFSTIEVVLRVKNQLRVRLLTEHMRIRTTILQKEVDDASVVGRDQRERHVRINQVTENADQVLTMVYQPIVELSSGLTVGAEALARFNAVPIRPPDEWFAEAAEAGVEVQLELAAIRKAISESAQLPVHAYLAVNASPSTIRSGALADLVSRGSARPLVVEMTERADVGDLIPLAEAMDRLSRHEVRFAVDDAGSGFVSLSHLLQLRPDIVKLDRALIENIDADPARRAVVSALVNFASETGITLIGQGIETAEELGTLMDMGVRLGQGYHLARPDHLPMSEVVKVDKAAVGTVAI